VCVLISGRREEKTVEREQRIEAMENAHSFPGLYPIIIFARNDPVFYSHLHAALMYEQDGAPFTIIERESSKKNFISFRIELFVESAGIALEREEFLSGLDGVLMML